MAAQLGGLLICRADYVEPFPTAASDTHAISRVDGLQCPQRAGAGGILYPQGTDRTSSIDIENELIRKSFEILYLGKYQGEAARAIHSARLISQGLDLPREHLRRISTYS